MDDASQIREATRDLMRRLEHLSHRPRGASPLLAGQVFTQTTLPGRSGVFYATNPTDVLAGAGEGQLGTISTNGEQVTMTALLGANLPGDGDYLVARGVDYRWVADSPSHCSLLVKPVAPYSNAPIIGAQVTLFWNHATKGAFLDPDSNDSSQGPYTTTSAGVTIPVEDPANEIYMVEVVATGYATVRYFVWACGRTCNAAGRMGTGYPAGPGTFTGSAVTPPLTISTNVGTQTLISNGTFGGTALAPIGGSFARKTLPSVIRVANPGGLTYHDEYDSCQDGAPGSPGFISVGCGGAGGFTVQALVCLICCPPGTNPLVTPSESLTPTDYQIIYSSTPAICRLNSTVTSIEYSPKTVIRGTWATAYTNPQSNTYPNDPRAPVLGPGAPSTVQPDSSLIPLTGDFVIQGT